MVLELPFADEEIGALCYQGDALGYILINTSLPRVNVNFAICHEIYHAFFQEKEISSRMEFFATTILNMRKNLRQICLREYC